MNGLWIEDGTVSFRTDLPPVEPGPGEVRVRVETVGVCATDLALARGYMGFVGVPGHEFVGVALDGELAGRRVVGEINAGCGDCLRCRAGDPRHCAERTVLGILGRPGAFAEELALPERNLHPVPDAVPNDVAVFAEPLAAAFEVPALLPDLARAGRALVVGDGRLGLLCAKVLARELETVEVLGRHPDRAALLPTNCRYRGESSVEALAGGSARWPLVVEASGRPELLQAALGLVEPRGTLVLKTTAERPAALDLAPLVVDEITLLGSRCGPFAPALDALGSGRVSVDGMVHARHPLEDGPRAFEQAGRRGTLKVLVDVARTADHATEAKR